MTASDALGKESARSNRLLLVGDGETVGQPIWSADFENLSLEERPGPFVDWGGTFELGEFEDGNQAFGSPVPAISALATSRHAGWFGASWLPYELEGSMLVAAGSTDAGVAVR